MDEEPTEKEKGENDFEEIELYNNSNLKDSECTFEPGCIISVTFIISGNSFLIDNASIFPEENEYYKTSIKIII